MDCAWVLAHSHTISTKIQTGCCPVQTDVLTLQRRPKYHGSVGHAALVYVHKTVNIYELMIQSVSMNPISLDAP
jgi:hypothetical protein